MPTGRVHAENFAVIANVVISTEVTALQLAATSQLDF
jgi:hypothetical protein